jgi:hypothetical protein
MCAAEAESYCNCCVLRALIALLELHFRLHARGFDGNTDHCDKLYLNLIELRFSIIQYYMKMVDTYRTMTSLRKVLFCLP